MTGRRKTRADAERSTARILSAAEAVLIDEPGATLERIADAAGLARTTVHRRFASRTALLLALTDQLNERYLQALADARVATAEPRVALTRLAQIVFEVKVGNRFASDLPGSPNDEVRAGLDLLFDRLRDAGEITATDPAWCRAVCLALLNEVHRLPRASPQFGPGDDIDARSALLAQTLLAALTVEPPTISRVR